MIDPFCSVTGTVRLGTFPIADLLFALAWSKVAPGLGGWDLKVSHIATGEIVEVVPPGAEFPVFYILPRAEVVEIIRERVIEVGGGQVPVACVPSLRNAVLLLCELDPARLAEAEGLVRRQGLVLAG